MNEGNNLEKNLKTKILDKAWSLQYRLEKPFKKASRLSFKTYTGFLSIVFLFMGMGIFMYLWLMGYPIDSKGLVLFNPIFCFVMGSVLYMVYGYLVVQRIVVKNRIRVWFENNYL